MDVHWVIFVGMLLLIGVGCTTVSDDLTFPLEPRINIVEISSDTLTEFSESLVLTLEYEDGDGDLGSADPDVNSIFVRDQRLAKPDGYYLAPLSPEGTRISITGRLQLELNPTFRLGNGATETTEFSITLVDRAGNESNVVRTGPILIIEP